MTTTATDKKAMLLDDAMKTLGGILLAISVALSSWALYQIYLHESRLVRVETKTEEVYRVLTEIRTDIREIKIEVKKQ